MTEITTNGAHDTSPTPIFDDAGPLERRLREMAARGELDLPIPHWHVERDPLPGEHSRYAKVVSAHRTQEPAGRLIMDYPERVHEKAGTTPAEVCFKKLHLTNTYSVTVMPDGRRFEAHMRTCRKPGCQIGLADLT